MTLQPEMIPKVVDRLKALADENRIRLLLRLRDAPANVTALTAELGIAQASVSKHLAVLKQAGLVEAQRAGAQVVYRVRDESIFDLCNIVCDGVARFIQAEHAALQLPLSRGLRRGA